jgi:PAS domain S-box-containing protein
MENKIIQSIINILPSGFVLHEIILDEAGLPFDYRFLEVNKTFETITGIKSFDLIGKTMKEALPEISKSGFIWVSDCLKTALEALGTEREYHCISLDKWYKVQFCSVDKMYFSTVYTDITEYKKQTEELEAFFSVNSNLLCIVDIEGNFRKTNEAWSHVLGWSAEELIKRKFLEFVHPDDIHATKETIDNLQKGNQEQSFINRYRAKNGSFHNFEWKFHPKGNLIYAVARDISDWIHAE